MFKITEQWLDDHKTKKGGWTKKQAATLHLTWPLIKGWKNKVIGMNITDKERVKFEFSSIITSKTKKPTNLTIDKCIDYLCKNMNKINEFHAKKLADIIRNYVDLIRK